MQKYFLITYILFLSACTTTRIEVRSNPPGAEIYVRTVGVAKEKLLGKTPLVIDSADIDQERTGTGSAIIELRKLGYKTDHFIITEISAVDLSIDRVLQPKKDFEYQVWLNQHIDEMFRVRELAQAKKFDEALQILVRLKESAPYVSALYELEGGVLLMSQKYEEALEAYRQAVRISPDRIEAAKMARYLEDTYGFKKEAEIYNAPSNFLKRAPSEAKVK